jgi:hypothetical protein
VSLQNSTALLDKFEANTAKKKSRKCVCVCVCVYCVGCGGRGRSKEGKAVADGMEIEMFFFSSFIVICVTGMLETKARLYSRFQITPKGCRMFRVKYLCRSKIQLRDIFIIVSAQRKNCDFQYCTYPFITHYAFNFNFSTRSFLYLHFLFHPATYCVSHLNRAIVVNCT